MEDSRINSDAVSVPTEALIDVESHRLLSEDGLPVRVRSGTFSSEKKSNVRGEGISLHRRNNGGDTASRSDTEKDLLNANISSPIHLPQSVLTNSSLTQNCRSMSSSRGTTAFSGDESSASNFSDAQGRKDSEVSNISFFRDPSRTAVKCRSAVSCPRIAKPTQINRDWIIERAQIHEYVDNLKNHIVHLTDDNYKLRKSVSHLEGLYANLATKYSDCRIKEEQCRSSLHRRNELLLGARKYLRMLAFKLKEVEKGKSTGLVVERQDSLDDTSVATLVNGDINKLGGGVMRKKKSSVDRGLSQWLSEKSESRLYKTRSSVLEMSSRVKSNMKDGKHEVDGLLSLGRNVTRPESKYLNLPLVGLVPSRRTSSAITQSGNRSDTVMESSVVVPIRNESEGGLLLNGVPPPLHSVEEQQQQQQQQQRKLRHQVTVCNNQRVLERYLCGNLSRSDGPPPPRLDIRGGCQQRLVLNEGRKLVVVNDNISPQLMRTAVGK